MIRRAGNRLIAARHGDRTGLVAGIYHRDTRSERAEIKAVEIRAGCRRFTAKYADIVAVGGQNESVVIRPAI